MIESAPSVRLHENLGLPSASEVRLSTFGNAARRESDLCKSLESAAERVRSLLQTPGWQTLGSAHPQAERLILNAVSQPLHAAHSEALCHGALSDQAGAASARACDVIYLTTN